MKLTGYIPFVIIGAICGMAAAPYGQLTDAERQARLERISATAAFEQRLELIFQEFLGAPYDREGPLGECGDDEDCAHYRDPDSRYGLTAATATGGEDCVTLRDKVLALAIATAPELRPVRQADGVSIIDLAKMLMDDMRYQRGQPISFATRNHFELEDFLPQQTGRYVEDITTRLGAPTLTLNGETRPEELGLPRPPQTVVATYIPRQAIAAIAAHIPQGALIYCLQPLRRKARNPGNSLVAHVGFVFQDGRQTYFGHASRSKQRVVREDFTAYFRRQTRYAGIMVLQVRMPPLEDVRMLVEQGKATSMTP